jgi:hypothetical protein
MGKKDKELSATKRITPDPGPDKEATGKSFRARDTLLKIGVSAQLDLSRSADNKAQVMLTICAGVSTYSLGRSFGDELRYPTLTLLVFSLAAALCAVASMKPPTPRRQPPRPGQPGFNILTFSHFAGLSAAEYRAAMHAITSDPKVVHDQIADAVWAFGAIFLRRQYYYLEWCYRIFLAGLLTSGLVWVFVMW